MMQQMQTNAPIHLMVYYKLRRCKIGGIHTAVSNRIRSINVIAR